MKNILKRSLPVILAAAVLAMSGLAVSSCTTEKTMYERPQSNKGAKVKSNIKVKGNNKANRHTTRSY